MPNKSTRIMKRCSTCKIDQEESEFYKRNTSKDGLDGRCKTCALKYAKKYYKNWKEGHKICTVCKLELPFSKFWKRKNCLFGIHYRCKECCKKVTKESIKKTNWESSYKKEKKKRRCAI